jgi:hypothetical protein
LLYAIETLQTGAGKIEDIAESGSEKYMRYEFAN